MGVLFGLKWYSYTLARTYSLSHTYPHLETPEMSFQRGMLQISWIAKKSNEEQGADKLRPLITTSSSLMKGLDKCQKTT